MNRPFLTAQWRHLAMLNYGVDPAVLQPFLPPGTELDAFHGVHYLTVVGFRFLDTRIFSLAVPFHRNFEEVNLRFYVRRQVGADWRRGVVFIRELVPRRAIALVARVFYGEAYSALPMRHRIDRDGDALGVEYAWRRANRWESLRISAIGRPQPLRSGSEEEFITDHYWGYTTRAGGCSEYAVEHPPWRVWRGVEASLEANVASLYGAQFAEALSSPPASAFIAEGSEIVVRGAGRLPVSQ